MFRNLASSLIQHERFETTLPKAKDLRRVVEKLITLAATDSLANRRLALSYLQTKDSVHKLFAEIGPRFKGRRGGFTRVVRTRTRVGDAAEMAVIEFVEKAGAPAPKSAKAKGKSGAGAKSSAATPSTEAASAGDAGAVKAAPAKASSKKTAAKADAGKGSKSSASKGGASAAASRKKKTAE
jgi:large subunit ribosomal protein L17